MLDVGLDVDVGLNVMLPVGCSDVGSGVDLDVNRHHPIRMIPVLMT